MKRLLCIVGSMNMGGAETFLMKLYRNFDRTKYQMDFAVAIAEKGEYDDEILNLGGRIYHITPKSKGTVKNFLDIKNLVRKEQYNYVLRVSQHSLSALELFAAMLGGSKVRAFRSSNSNACAGKINGLIHKLCMFMPRNFANRYIAPSTEAASFMFGENYVKSGRVLLLRNAVNHSLFAYNTDYRAQIRQELGILDNDIVVGHIGRFNHQKNHTYLLDVFSEILKLKRNSKLILVGKGEKETQIIDYAKQLGIIDFISIISPRHDVNKLYSVFDVLVFPSLFEGMPNVIIEAQAASLPCVTSDSLTKEAEITKYVSWMPLSDSPQKWASKALEMVSMSRQSTIDEFRSNKYEIKDSVHEFCHLIFDEK